MKTKTIDRQKLTAYLLGTLPEAEQEQIAEQYFINDELFEQLLEVENDLIRQYARGRLRPKDRLRFESYLKILPEGRREVAFTRALSQIIPEERADTGTPLSEEPAPAVVVEQYPARTAGLWQTLTGWLAQPAPAWVTAVGLIALGGVIWLFIYNRQLSNSNERLLAQMRERDARQTQSLVEVERKFTEEQTRNAQLRQELERLHRKTQAPVQAPAFPSPRITWLLSSLKVRGSDQSSEALRLDRKAKTVALIIPDEGKRKYAGYKVELRTEDGRRILWKDNQPYTPPMRREKDIVFYRPASEFVAASYKLTLTLINSQETTTRDYYFTVAT